MAEVTRAMLEDPNVLRRLGELGFEPLPPMTPEEMLPFARAT